MVDEIKLQKITYYRQVKPPTISQFLVRKAIAEAGRAAKGETGVSADGSRFLPNSAITVRDRVKGLTADQIAIDHPLWVEEYKEKYGGAKS